MIKIKSRCWKKDFGREKDWMYFDKDVYLRGTYTWIYQKDRFFFIFSVLDMSRMFPQNWRPKFAEISKICCCHNQCFPSKETRFTNTVPIITQQLFNRFASNFSSLYDTLLHSYWRGECLIYKIQHRIFHSSQHISQKGNIIPDNIHLECVPQNAATSYRR